MSTILKKKSTFRRKRAREPMVDGDVDSAEAVTHTRIAETQYDGTTVFKHIVESLDNPILSLAGDSQFAGQSQMDASTSHENFNDDQLRDMSPQNTPRHRKSRVSIYLNIEKDITISFRLKRITSWSMFLVLIIYSRLP
jgi:hypothetical protein